MRLRSRPGPVPRPVLPVRELAAASAFYARLGFEVVAHDPGYAWLRHHGSEVAHLRVVAGLDTSANAAGAYLLVDDPDAWHARWSDAGAPVGPIRDEPWGMREFAVEDPDGNVWRVGRNA